MIEEPNQVEKRKRKNILIEEVVQKRRHANFE